MMEIDWGALRKIDPRTLVGGSDQMERVTPTEWAMRCPLPGCTSKHDAFHVKQTADGWKWFCRKCSPRWGSAIDLVMRLHGVDELGAAMMLRDMRGVALAEWREPEPRKVQWDSKEWQIDIERKLFTLYDPEKKETWRGLDYHTLKAFGVKFGPAYSSMEKRMIEAAWLPWQNKKITEVQVRFLEGKQRYTSQAGGERIIFGAHLLDYNRRNLLWVVEGEINAMSVWQVTRNQAADVISIGPSSPGGKSIEVAKVLVSKYKNAIVWTDEQEASDRIAEAIGAREAISTPRDANDLLQEEGDALWQTLQIATLWW